MYKKLFGETLEEQKRYLQLRVILSVIAIVALLLDLLIFKVGFGEKICVIVLLMWGWSILKAIWGVTSLLSIFSLGFNFVITIVILIGFILVGYLGGILVFPIGVYRYICILTNKKG